MPKLTAKEVEIYYNPVREWEDIYGVDWPCCEIPYWVDYMPRDEKLEYLSLCKGEYID